VLHVHVFMLLVHAVMSLLHVHVSFPCSMSIQHVHAACHGACPCRLSMLHTRAACPFCMPIVHVHVSMLHVYAAWHGRWSCARFKNIFRIKGLTLSHWQLNYCISYKSFF
jgi:hypothetical protein